MHNNAFGINFPKEELNTVIQKCNEMCPLDTLCTIHQVDWQIPATKLKKKMVQEVADNYAIWGNGISAPLFAITELHIAANQINGYGENYGFIRFVYNGITFVKKYCPIGDYEKMTMKDRKILGVNKKPLVLNIIGQFVLNAWEDKINPEVKILFYDVREDTGEEIDIKNYTNTKNNIKEDNINKTQNLKSKNKKSEKMENDTKEEEKLKIDDKNKVVINVKNKIEKEDEAKENKVKESKAKDKVEEELGFTEKKKVVKKVTIDDDFDF